jgi:hypothetical protein
LTALRHDDVAAIAFWRDRIVRAGGIAGTREPWCESLWRRRAIQREGARETRQADFDTDGLDPTTLKGADALLHARRRRKLARSANPPPASARLRDAATASVP